MKKHLIRKLEKRINEKIPNQQFKYESDYTLDGLFCYVVFKSEIKPRRKITASVKATRFGIDLNSFKCNDPGFNESDNDYNRICSILDDVIPHEKYCIYLTGYFDDTPDTVYQEEKKVYPPAAFGVWIDPGYIPKDSDLIDLCKDCGVLALSVEYITSKLFKNWTDMYDTKEIVQYHDQMVDDLKREGVVIPGRDYCFKEPFNIRKETDPEENGYLESECY